MALPVRTTLDDVVVVCKYLSGKPTGASLDEARKILDAKHLEARKLSALRRWGLIEHNDGRFKVTALGRTASRPDGLVAATRQVVREVAQYNVIVERAAHRADTHISTTDVASYWHEHFRDDVGDSEDQLVEGVLAFFQLAVGAGLGAVVLGRKGSPTRFTFDAAALKSYSEAATVDTTPIEAEAEPALPGSRNGPAVAPAALATAVKPDTSNRRVFITHGKNKSMLDQLKEIVRFGKFEPIVAAERETVSKPVPDKVMDDMRSCFASIIHVTAEEELIDAAGNARRILNENVLIEIGASMALYGRNFVLLVESGVRMPSNLQGLYECRYSGDSLDGAATMKLLKIFNDMR